MVNNGSLFPRPTPHLSVAFFFFLVWQGMSTFSPRYARLLETLYCTQAKILRPAFCLVSLPLPQNKCGVEIIQSQCCNNFWLIIRHRPRVGWRNMLSGATRRLNQSRVSVVHKSNLLQSSLGRQKHELYTELSVIHSLYRNDTLPMNWLTNPPHNTYAISSMPIGWEHVD